MMFVAGARLRDFFIFVSLAAGAAVILDVTRQYRLERLTGFLDPWADPYDKGFQLTQSLIAIGRGEWFGVGLGESVQKLFYLPDAHTDFVFAVLGEEMGLIGVMIVIGLLLVFAWRGYRIVYLHPEQFGRYLSFGITTSIIFQAFLNIAVVSGLLPTTGLPLPLFSQGGSSMLITLMMCGLLVGLSKQKTKETVNIGTSLNHQFESVVLEDRDHE